MSTQTLKVVIFGALLVHGIGHTGALIALLMNSSGYPTGEWSAARSWLLPSLSAPMAKNVAIAFWVMSTVGFVAAAMSFWGILLPALAWRQLAIASAAVSVTGIVLFLGNWPVFNTVAALGMNIAVLATQIRTHWPPEQLFGR